MRAYSHQGHGPRAEQQAEYKSATSDSTLTCEGQPVHTNGARRRVPLLRPDIVTHATFTVAQLIEIILESGDPSGPISVLAAYDELSLSLRPSYRGALLKRPETRPSLDAVIETTEGERDLAGYLVRHSADHVRTEQRSDLSVIDLLFIQ